MTGSLDRDVARIETREDLARFILTLARDAEEQPAEWANRTLPQYLEALAAWLPHLDRFYENGGQVAPEQPTWNVLGHVLYAGKWYE